MYSMIGDGMQPGQAPVALTLFTGSPPLKKLTPKRTLARIREHLIQHSGFALSDDLTNSANKQRGCFDLSSALKILGLSDTDEFRERANHLLELLEKESRCTASQIERIGPGEFRFKSLVSTHSISSCESSVHSIDELSDQHRLAVNHANNLRQLPFISSPRTVPPPIKPKLYPQTQKHSAAIVSEAGHVSNSGIRAALLKRINNRTNEDELDESDDLLPSSSSPSSTNLIISAFTPTHSESAIMPISPNKLSLISKSFSSNFRESHLNSMHNSSGILGGSMIMSNSSNNTTNNISRELTRRTRRGRPPGSKNRDHTKKKLILSENSNHMVSADFTSSLKSVSPAYNNFPTNCSNGLIYTRGPLQMVPPSTLNQTTIPSSHIQLLSPFLTRATDSAVLSQNSNIVINSTTGCNGNNPISLGANAIIEAKNCSAHQLIIQNSSIPNCASLALNYQQIQNQSKGIITTINNFTNSQTTSANNNNNFQISCPTIANTISTVCPSSNFTTSHNNIIINNVVNNNINNTNNINNSGNNVNPVSPTHHQLQQRLFLPIEIDTNSALVVGDENKSFVSKLSPSIIQSKPLDLSKYSTNFTLQNGEDCVNGTPFTIALVSSQSHLHTPALDSNLGQIIMNSLSVTDPNPISETISTAPLLTNTASLDDSICFKCQIPTKNGGPSIQCESCGKIAHLICLNYWIELVEYILQFDFWHCSDCKLCQVCKQPGNEHNQLHICDKCDRSFHSECHCSRIVSKSEFGLRVESWVCALCKNFEKKNSNFSKNSPSTDKYLSATSSSLSKSPFPISSINHNPSNSNSIIIKGKNRLKKSPLSNGTCTTNTIIINNNNTTDNIFNANIIKNDCFERISPNYKLHIQPAQIKEEVINCNSKVPSVIEISHSNDNLTRLDNVVEIDLCDTSNPSNTISLEQLVSKNNGQSVLKKALSRTNTTITTNSDSKKLKTESSISSGDNHIKYWSTTKVVSWLFEIGFEKDAETFKNAEIDGISLLLLTRDDLICRLRLPLGRAVKLCRRINDLRINAVSDNFLYESLPQI